MPTTKPRAMLTLSEELKSYYEGLSDKMGISTSAIMVMALQYYKDQRETLDNMGDIKSLVEKIELLEKNKSK